MVMQFRRPRLPLALVLVAAASATAWPGPAAAQTAADGGPLAEPEAAAESDSLPEERGARLDALFERLAAADDAAHERWEQEIRRLWNRSGSDTADLLLKRGRDAMEAEARVRAIHHFTALVQHRPDFAEGWNARATAFYAEGELGLALVDIERTLALEPRHWGALTGLGVIMEQVDRPADALAAYRAAAAVNPHVEQVNEAIERLAPDVDGRDA